MPRRDVILALSVAVIWGVNFVVLAIGLEDMPPLLFVALRFVAVLLPAVFLVPRPDVPWRVVLTVGLFLSLGQFALLYLGLAAGMPPGLAGLVLQAQVLLTVLLAAVRLHESPTRAQAAGIALGAVGLVVVGTGRSEHTPLLGLLLVLAAALCWAVGNVASRQAGVASGLSMTVWSALVVPVPMVLLSLLVDGPRAVAAALTGISLSAVLATAYTAYLSSLVGYGIWNTLLARRRTADVVPFVLLVPPVAVLAAWLVQGEVPNAAEAAGGALLLAGVAVALVGSRPARRAAPAASDRTARVA